MQLENTAVLAALESNQTSSQPFPHWQSSRQDDNSNAPIQQDLKSVQPQQHQEQHSSVMELKQHGSAAENQQQQHDASQEPNHLPLHQKQSQNDLQQGQMEQVPLQTPQATGMQISEKNAVPISESNKTQNPDSDPQYQKFQKIGNQQTTGMEQAGNQKNHSKQIPFMLLLPALKPHLDKDREMQLQTLFNKLRVGL